MSPVRTRERSGAAMVPVRLRARSGAALLLVSLAGLVAFCWPLLVTPGARITQSTFAPWIFVLLLPLLLAVALAEVAEGGIDAKAIALLGVLGAVGAALRPLGTSVAGFEPMFFVLVHGGRVLGRGFGYLLGSVTMFASALITAGVGPWLPYQILGAAWVGFFAGCLPRRPRGRVEIAMLAAYGAVAAFLYGWLQNLGLWPFAGGMSSSISFHPGAPLTDNLGRFVAFDLATSLGFDLPRAVFTAILVAVTGRPVLLALRRAARRAAFEAPPGRRPADGRADGERPDHGNVDHERPQHGRADDGQGDDGHVDGGRADHGQVDDGPVDDGRADHGPVGDGGTGDGR